MAPIAARKASVILQNVQKIVAIELLYAAQGLDLRKKQSSNKSIESLFGRGTATAYQELRKKIPFMATDQPLYPHIWAAVDLVRSNIILEKVENKIGALD